MSKGWSSEDADRLKNLSNSHSSSEIGVILNRTTRAIKIKQTKLNISGDLHKWETKQCILCNSKFESRKKESRKFCSKSCAATYNGPLRSKNSRDKQKTTLDNTLRLKGLHLKKDGIRRIRTNSLKIDRKCKKCNSQVVTKFKQICDTCILEYYKHYRVECNFKFSIKDFAFLFGKDQIELIETHGMYSSINRGGNCKGVSRDHVFSVYDGFKNNIEPFIIRHPTNCRIVKHEENQRKHRRSDISLKDFYYKIITSENTKEYLNVDEFEIVNKRYKEFKFPFPDGGLQNL